MKKVLILEDDWAQYEDIRARLTEQKFIPSDFTNTFEAAKEKLDSFGPDVVLVDIDLNGPLNGFDFAHYLDQNKKTPYIFLSSYGQAEFRVLANKTKAKYYLVKQKPLLTDQLMIALDFAFKRDEQCQLEQSGLWVLPMPKRDNEGKLIRAENDQRIQEKPVLKYEDVVKIVRGQGDMHHKIIFEVHDGRQYCHPKSLNGIEDLLPEEFIRAERGIIINMNFINSRISGRLLNVNGELIPIGKKYLDEVNAILKKKFLDL